jgi:cyclohexadienyl dehydratase
MIPVDDADYSRVMGFVWALMESRGMLKQTSDKWLK